MNTNTSDATKSGFVSRIAKNPIYTALVVTIVILLLTIIMFHEGDFDDLDTSFRRRLFRHTLGIFIIVLGAQFLSASQWQQELAHKKANNGFNQILGGAIGLDKDRMNISQSGVVEYSSESASDHVYDAGLDELLESLDGAIESE